MFINYVLDNIDKTNFVKKKNNDFYYIYLKIYMLYDNLPDDIIDYIYSKIIF